MMALPGPEHGLWTHDFRKRWHKAVCQINVYSVKMTASLALQQSPLSEVDFVWHLVKSFVRSLDELGPPDPACPHSSGSNLSRCSSLLP